MTITEARLRNSPSRRRNGLLAGAIADARRQLESVRRACEEAGGDPDYAEARWRRTYPGLTEIVDYAEGES